MNKRKRSDDGAHEHRRELPTYVRRSPSPLPVSGPRARDELLIELDSSSSSSAATHASTSMAASTEEAHVTRVREELQSRRIAVPSTFQFNLPTSRKMNQRGVPVRTANTVAVLRVMLPAMQANARMSDSSYLQELMTTLNEGFDEKPFYVRSDRISECLAIAIESSRAMASAASAAAPSLNG